MNANNDGLPVGTLVPELSIFDTFGCASPLAAQWHERPALLFFMRHAGCAVCRAHLREIRAAYPQIVAHGGQVTAIALTDAGLTAGFMDRRHFPFPVLVDPSRTIYRAFGLMEGSFLDVSGPRVAVAQLAQAINGNLPYVWPGASLSQLGGSFIVDQHGVVRFAHVARPIYEHPSIANYLTVFDAIAGEK